MTITTVKVVQVFQVKLTITSQQETNVWKKADKRSFPSPPEKNCERLRLQDYLLLKTLLFLLRTKQDMAEFLPKNRHLFSGLIFNYCFSSVLSCEGLIISSILSLALKNSIKVCKIFSSSSKSFIINAILICP